MFDYYPEPADLDPGDQQRQSSIDKGLHAYLASPNKSKIKFCLMVQQAWLMGHGSTSEAKQMDSMAALTRDPQYMKINGRPVVGLGFNSASMDLTTWNTFLALTGSVYLIIIDGSSAAATTLQADALTYYGPIQPMPTGGGQHSFASQSALNRSHWPASFTVDAFPNVIVLNDRRPFLGISTNYVDQPSQPELVEELIAAMKQPRARGWMVHAWNEIAESGPGITPGVQEGTRYLDAIKWARGGIRPGSYSYQINAHSKLCNTSGTWSYTQPDPSGGSGVQGNYDSDEITSVTTNDFVELTHQLWTAAILYAAVGPDRGIVQIQVDGSTVATVDLYATTQAPHVAVWTGSLSGVQSHTVRAIVTGTKNAASSSVMVGLDSFGITYQP